MSRNTIAITGIGGYLGRMIMPLLEQDAMVERVIGIDTRTPENMDRWHKLEFHRADVRDPSLIELLAGADVLCHMAFKLWRQPGDKDIDEINIQGSHHVFDTAVEAGIRKIVFTSSTVVYGIHPDNPTPLTEESPIRPNLDHYYGRAKAACEARLNEIGREHPEMVVTIMRPSAIAGPNAPRKQLAPYVSESVFVIRGYDPPGQFVHEDDVIDALVLVMQKDLPGIYNVTTEDAQSLRQSVLARGGRAIELPVSLIRILLWVAWRTGSSVAGPEWISLNMYPFIASSQKLRGEGWQPKYTSAETYQAIVEAFGEGS